MSRRFSTILLLLVSFAAGLLLANRMRESTEAVAQAPAPSRPTVATPVASHVIGRDAHRFQSHRRAHHPGCRQHLVAASRAAAGAIRPVLQSALRRSRRDLRLAPRGRKQPRLGCHRQQRRLHPHKQSRRHWRGTPGDDRAARCHRCARGQARDARRCRGRGSSDRPRRAEDRREESSDDPVGRLLETQGRRVGARRRQSLSVESDRHAGHRVGGRDERTSASRRTRISFRPTPRSIPETPAVRW